jgi:hypothetical protein
VTPLYPQKLALTSPTGGGRSVGIVRLRTKATEFSLVYVFGEQLPAGTDLYLILVMSVACGGRSNEGADSLFTSRLGSQ